jgi:hypothetical protein
MSKRALERLLIAQHLVDGPGKLPQPKKPDFLVEPRVQLAADLGYRDFTGVALFARKPPARDDILDAFGAVLDRELRSRAADREVFRTMYMGTPVPAPDFAALEVRALTETFKEAWPETRRLAKTASFAAYGSTPPLTKSALTRGLARIAGARATHVIVDDLLDAPWSAPAPEEEPTDDDRAFAAKMRALRG